MDTAILIGLVASIIFLILAISTPDKRLARRIANMEGKIDLLMKEADVEPPPVPRIDEITSLVRDGKMIEAIKIYREGTGVGLAEAKNAVERL